MLCAYVLLAGVIHSKPEKTILDFFKEIEHPLLTRSLAGPDSEEPEKPVEKDEILSQKLKNPDGKKARLTVDIPNYFIEVRHEPRAGIEYRQYALYSPERDPIFAISRRYLAYDTNFIAFLTKRNGAWSDVTSEVFPTVDIELFAKKPSSIREKQKLLKYGTFSYALPRQGTSITVEFQVDSFKWVESGISENNSTTVAQLDAQLKALLEPLTYQFVQFKWNKAERRFQISRKVKRQT
jgi:hypothetical protein